MIAPTDLDAHREPRSAIDDAIASTMALEAVLNLGRSDRLEVLVRLAQTDPDAVLHVVRDLVDPPETSRTSPG